MEAKKIKKTVKVKITMLVTVEGYALFDDAVLHEVNAQVIASGHKGTEVAITETKINSGPG